MQSEGRKHKGQTLPEEVASRAMKRVEVSAQLDLCKNRNDINEDLLQTIFILWNDLRGLSITGQELFFLLFGNFFHKFYTCKPTAEDTQP